MKTTNIINGATRAFNRMGLKFKKHSPEILVVAGVAGTVASTIMACKATTKVGTILDKVHEDMHELNLVAIAAGIKADDEDKYTDEDMTRIDTLAKNEAVQNYTVDDFKKDTAIIYTQSAIKFVKLYGPAVLIGALSVTSILAGHNITRKRNAALAAAYATVDRGFKEYRNRVIERFGQELDKELKYNVKAKEIEETVTDSKGKEKTVKKTVNVADPNDYSIYARIFDESCLGWTKNAEDNLTFLKIQQSYANEKLKSQGYLFLNDVYKMLGFPMTKAGQIVGWIYDEEHPVGDNFVDFGIYEMYREKCREFVNGYERSIILDFNVDGNILDML